MRSESRPAHDGQVVHRGGDVGEPAGAGSPQRGTAAGTLTAMIPTLGIIWGLTISTHDALVGAGLVATVAVCGFEKRRRAMTDERLWVVVALALAWGAEFARLGTWVQHVDLSQNDALAQHWLYGSRSILGGLTGAYLGALHGKDVTGYRERTGALFAPAVAAGMAIGRIGCLLAESPGAATGQAWGVVLNKTDAALMGSPANIPLHPWRAPATPCAGNRIHLYVNAFCPHCHDEAPEADLAAVGRLLGWLVVRDDRVWLERGCPRHGMGRTLYDESPEILTYLEQWTTPTKSHVPDRSDNYLPVPAAYELGLPATQTQHTCILLEDITEHWNLRCPTCFAQSSPDLQDIALIGWLGGPWALALFSAMASRATGRRGAARRPAHLQVLPA